jgi:hypothetical protein
LKTIVFRYRYSLPVYDTVNLFLGQTSLYGTVRVSLIVVNI